MNQDFDLILPIAAADLDVAILTIPYIKKYIAPSEIVVISNKQVRGRVDALNDNRIRFLDEDNVIEGLSFGQLKSYLSNFSAERRTGWYFQQFLKMGYALITEKEYYMSWDADMIPLKKICPFQNGKPVFSIKKEYHKPYFDTIENLFDLKKKIKGSFVAEHMIFKSSYMQEIIGKLSCEKEWYYKIIDSISPKDITQSGFSEFETYGTYIMEYHPEAYRMENFKAIRKGKMIFGKVPNADVMEWLSKNFSSIVFEKTQQEIVSHKLYNSKLFRAIVPSSVYIFGTLVDIKIHSLIVK